MKRFSLMMLYISVMILAKAQEANQSWKFTGEGLLNFSQTTFHNWAKGGDNNISVTGLVNLGYGYNNDTTQWENILKLAYGKIKSGQLLRKSDDLIDFSSKYSQRVSDKFALSGVFSFKSQFDNGYNYPDDSTVISRFMSPGLFMLSVGADYKHTKGFSLYFSPLTGKATIVSDTVTIDQEKYGVKAGKKHRLEMGAFLKAAISADILENVSLATSLELFSNFVKEPQNIDLNWELLISMKVNSFIKASIATQVIYDHDIMVPISTEGTTRFGRGTQFREVFAIGLSYTIK